jgi:hypothetical protein
MYKMMNAEERARKKAQGEQMQAGTTATSDPAAARAAAAKQLVEEAAARASGQAPVKDPGQVRLEGMQRRRVGGRTVADVLASLTGLPGGPTPMVPQPGKKAARPL